MVSTAGAAMPFSLTAGAIPAAMAMCRPLMLLLHPAIPWNLKGLHGATPPTLHEKTISSWDAKKETFSPDIYVFNGVDDSWCNNFLISVLKYLKRAPVFCAPRDRRSLQREGVDSITALYDLRYQTTENHIRQQDSGQKRWTIWDPCQLEVE